MTIPIEAMFAGDPRPLGQAGRTSAIHKKKLEGPWLITSIGLRGDQQADLEHHGGPDKALHHYPREHYAAWAAETPELAEQLIDPPAFGENLSTLGLTEADVCIGDVMRMGETVLQVSQARQPCWKLNAKFARRDLAKRVQDKGRTGWYYRVLTEGWVAVGDSLELIERPQPAWPLSRLTGLLYHRLTAFDELAAVAELPELARGWRKLAAQRVQSRKIEDWSSRLEGDAPAWTPPASEKVR